MARLTLEIETRRDPTTPYAGGRTRYRWLAMLGEITGIGPTEAAAKADLRAIIESHAGNTTPRAVWGPDGSAVIAWPAECSTGDVCCAVIRPGSDRPSCTTMGEQRGRTLLECARDHAKALS